MKRTVATITVVAAALLAGATPAASASTPAAYRAHLNSLCRSYTPRIHALEADAEKAGKAKDGLTFGSDLGELLVLALAQDARIEATPVPAALRTQMAPILRSLRTIDAHARLAIVKAGRRDSQGMFAELDTIGRLSAPLNKLLDRAGLRDCGSNQ